MEPLFSIIIPAYNARGKINIPLDSIYAQGIPMEKFEVICVDDCSPDPASLKFMEDYKEQHNLPNMQILCHKENRRQGGARNTGVRAAKSRYIMFIDQDDYFADGAFGHVVSQLEDSDLDMVMWDHTFHKYNQITEHQYEHNHVRAVDGMTFILENECTWAPWGYSYKREFLLANDLKFVECVQFEDADFVTKCVSYAKSIRFNPFSLIHYTVNLDSQTAIGSDTMQKMDFLFQISSRLRDVAFEIGTRHEAAGNKVYGFSEISYMIAIKRLIQFRDMKGRQALINKYIAGQFNNSPLSLLRYASRYPNAFTTCLNLGSPLLRRIVIAKMNNKLKHNRNMQISQIADNEHIVGGVNLKFASGGIDLNTYEFWCSRISNAA